MNVIMRCRCLAVCLALSPWPTSAVLADEPVPPPGRLLIRAGHLLDIRTGAGAAGYADVDLRDAIDAGLIEGPHMQVSGPI